MKRFPLNYGSTVREWSDLQFFAVASEWQQNFSSWVHFYNVRSSIPRPSSCLLSIANVKLSLVENKVNSQVCEYVFNSSFSYSWSSKASSLLANLFPICFFPPYRSWVCLQFSLCFNDVSADRALFVFESSFHPLFSLTQGTSRLEYRLAENRFESCCSFPVLMPLLQRRHLVSDCAVGCCLALCYLIISKTFTFKRAEVWFLLSAIVISILLCGLASILNAINCWTSVSRLSAVGTYLVNMTLSLT